MKKMKMVLMSVAFTCLFLSQIKAQEYMRIKKSDGSIVQIQLSDIRKVTFDNIVSTSPEQMAIIGKVMAKIKAYPNPASEKVNINYQLNVASSVVIEFYNMSGMRIDKAELGNKPSGEQTYSWVPSNLPSGTYICKIVTTDELFTQKIVINKN